MGFQLSDIEQEKIIASIKVAEEKTSAEIFAVFTKRSDDYRFIAYSFWSFWIFIVSVLLTLWLGWQGIDLTSAGWGQSEFGIEQFVWCQLLAFLCGAICFRIFPQLCVMIAPKRITDERAHNNAVKQFLAHGIHHTSGRTGVLIFVSLEERYGEILVDGAIEDSFGQELLLQKVKGLIDHCSKGNISQGYVETIESLGGHLEKAFPAGVHSGNELEDRFVIL